MQDSQDYFQSETIKNISVASSGVWIFTHATHYFLSLLIVSLGKHPVYIIYSGIVSFLCSLFIVFTFSHRKNDFGLKPISISVLNALLLYVTVNGIHSAYSTIDAASPSKNPQARLVPFINPEPWLPPLSMKKKIDLLSEEVTGLEQQVEGLRVVKDSLSSLVERCEIITDSIYLLTVPKASAIYMGEDYVSDLHLVARINPAYVQSLSVNGQKLETSANRFIDSYKLLQKVNAASQQSVQRRDLNFHAEVELLNGERKTLHNKTSYDIMRPVISVSSRAVPTLYLNCRHEVDFTVSGLMPASLTFQGDGGTVLRSEEGSVHLIPSSSEMKVNVFNNDILIGTKGFKVRNVPPPTIVVESNGRQLNSLSPGLRQLSVVAKPDDDFQAMLPIDATFEVTQCEIALVRGARAVAVRRYNLAAIDLKEILAPAKVGDVVVIEVRAVRRRNFRGENEVVKEYGPRIHTLKVE